MKTLAATSTTSENIENLPEDVRKLMEKVRELPMAVQEELSETLTAVVRGTRRRCETLHLVQEAVSQVRLDMKYLLFDLEATRRERDQYRKS